jgi:hypothetical protein
MKYVAFTAKVVGTLLLLMLLALVVMLFLFRYLEHGVKVIGPSPSGYRVAVLHDLGEQEDPGYGEQLVIHWRWAPLKNMWGTPIFRGYCGHPASLQWRTNTELELRCDTFKDVSEQRFRYDDVRITYVGEER